MSCAQISASFFTGTAMHPVSTASCRMRASVAAAVCALFAGGALAQTAPSGQIGLPVIFPDENIVIETNQAGQVLGISLEQYGVGLTSWLYSDGNTREIGLNGSQYLDIQFKLDNQAEALNEAGQAVGRSRWSWYPDGGQTAWFYDDDLDQTFAMAFSTSYQLLPDDGSGSPFLSYRTYTFSQISYLGEDGLALGSFREYSDFVSGGDNSFIGDQLFAWTIAGGKQNLGPLTGTPESVNWEVLAQEYRAMTPVPEPESWAMLLAGLGLTARVASLRRRRDVLAAKLS